MRICVFSYRSYDCFARVTLTLTLTLIYELDRNVLKMYLHTTEIKFLCQGFRKLITNRINIHTDAIERIISRVRR